MSRAAERGRMAQRLVTALREAGCGELRLTVYPSGVVVNDGDSLWTARPGDLLRSAARVRRELGDIRRKVADKAEQSVRAYDRLCESTRVLSRGDDREQAMHGRIVKAWRRDNPGYAGNWT